MSHEIIMPVLGMNQDTGIIASWQKSVGDYVNAGDVVMEVETDKAIQEIEAFESGYLSQILYPAESDVPVGEVVGLITAEMPDAAELAATQIPVESAASESAEAAPTEAVREGPNKSSATTDPKPESRAISNSSGLVLASAKARAAAYKENVSLTDVAESSGKSPLHAADVDTYLRNRQLSPQVMTSSANQGAVLSFKVKSKGLRHCEQWLADSGVSTQPLLSSHLVATLVMGLWRELMLLEVEGALAIDVSCFGADGFRLERLQDADKQRFSNLTPDASDQSGDADIQLIDLRNSRIENYQPSEFSQPLFVVSSAGKKTSVSLHSISTDQSAGAIALMDLLARQIEEPLIYIA